VYWSQATGAHELYDQILTRYDAIGAEISKLGLPTSGPTGTRVLYSRYNVFEHGRMYYSPGTATQPVLGAINDRYIQADAYPLLGLPTADEYAVTDALAQTFQHGQITWNRHRRDNPRRDLSDGEQHRPNPACTRRSRKGAASCALP
jgi:hypothetical protein